QQLVQLLAVLGVVLAQAFDNEEPDLHLSSEEAGGRPVSDEAVARVLVEVDVGVNVVRVFNMAGPAEQRIVHILGGFPDALGQQGKHRRDQCHPLLDNLGSALAHESRQLSPQRAFLTREPQQLTAAHVMLDTFEVLFERLFKKRLHNGVAFPPLFPYRLCFVVTIPLLRGPFSDSQGIYPYHFIFFSLLCMVTEVPCVQTGGKVAPGEGLKHPVLMGRERLDRARLLACPSVNEWSRKNGLRHTTIPTYSLCCASRRETWKRSSSSSTSTLRRRSTSPLIFSERGREPKRLPRRCFCRSTAGRSVMSPRPSSRPGCSRSSTTTV